MSTHQTITSAAKALRAGETSAEELVGHALRRADRLDAELGVFLSRYTEDARVAALELDARIARGYTPTGLDGIPLGIKDMLAESRGPTTAQSLVPAPGSYRDDAPAVARLKRAGAIVMGKLTMGEYGTGIQDPAKPFPIQRNAWDAERSAAGSSSGCASGVAAEMFLGALGTDTGGSIRAPAAYNGTSGLKPTYGRVPRTGVIPLSPTMDHVGPIARSAADCALLLSVIGDAPGDDCAGALTGDLTGLRVGHDDLDRHADGGIDPAQPGLMAHALHLLTEAGAEVAPVRLPMYEECLAVAWVVILAESFAYHRPRLRERWNDYGRYARRSFAGGAVVDAADYLQAQRVRRVVQSRLSAMFEQVDLIVTPTLHLGAPRLHDLYESDLRLPPSLHAHYWNPVGSPTLAIPIGLSSQSMPLSLSISGRPWDDALVLRAGDAIQQRSTFHLDRTPLLDGADLTGSDR